MNYRMISYIVGQIIRVEGILMLLPLACTLIYGDGNYLAFLLPILGALLVGTLLTLKKPKNSSIYAKEGFVTVGLSWLILSLIGALPFVIGGEIPSYVDAFFETVSGFTTSGGSILSGEALDRLSHGILFWRSFTHWIGGMGVLVFVMALLPSADTRQVKLMHVMRAEVPGPKVGKLVSKISRTARIMYGLYVALTAIEVIFLVAGGMPFFDSLLNSFGTAGTGGFSISSAGIAGYQSAYIEYVIGVFMMLFGVNFNLFYLMVLGHFGEAMKSEELHWYIGIIALATGLFTFDLLRNAIYPTFGEAVRYSFFQVSTLVTTTGYATADFNLWPPLSQAIICMLLFCGGCVGSTAGGFKIGRLLLLVKTGFREIKYMLHPRAVIPVRSERKSVEPEVVRGASSYLIVFIMLFSASFFLIQLLDGPDLITGFTSVAACLNNVGPGLGKVGPMGNYGFYSVASKLILSFDMLAGRLEIFPLIMLFAPSTWKNN